MDRLFLHDVFKILVQSVFGPMICDWYKAKLYKRSKPKKKQHAKRPRQRRNM
jgi:hypothetical protein